MARPMSCLFKGPSCGYTAAVNVTLKPLRIGPLELDFPVVLAALAGYSDAPYRLICRSCGAPYAATEVILDRSLIVSGRLQERLLTVDPADHPLAGQIMGNDPETMARAAAMLRGAGFDVIDLNFACPVKKVLARKRGGFLLTQPDLALDIVRAVRAAVPDRPLTLKLRRSFRENDRECKPFWAIARGGFEAGVDAIAVHGRSVDQKYQGKDDREFLKRVKMEFSDRTIIGSGEVLSAAEALRMIEATGVDGVLAARGAIGNPWLFRQARDLAAGREALPPTLEEQRDLIGRHHRLAAGLYGPRRGALYMRNFAIRYSHVHPHPLRIRMAAIRIKSEADWTAFFEAWYGGRPEEGE
jgi:tRNA-dihydrouridine synthase B